MIVFSESTRIPQTPCSVFRIKTIHRAHSSMPTNSPAHPGRVRQILPTQEIFPDARAEPGPVRRLGLPPGDRNTYRPLGVDSTPIEPEWPPRGPRPRIPRRLPSARHLPGRGSTIAEARSRFGSTWTVRGRTECHLRSRACPERAAPFRLDCHAQNPSATLQPGWLRGIVFRDAVRSLTRTATRFGRSLRLLEPVIERSGQSIEPPS